MPKGVYIKTEEHKRKLSEARKGKISNAKGKHWKIQDTRRMNKSRIGKKWDEKTRKKISEANKGEKCYLWKGGISPENKRIRQGIEFRLWRESIFARDNWTCQKCKIKGGRLHPHHIQNFSQYPELRFAIDNGITFCKDCHWKFHKIYGKQNNTKEQLEEFCDEI